MDDHSGRVGVVGRKRPGNHRIGSPQRDDRSRDGLLVEPGLSLAVELHQNPGQVLRQAGQAPGRHDDLTCQPVLDTVLAGALQQPGRRAAHRVRRDPCVPDSARVGAKRP